MSSIRGRGRPRKTDPIVSVEPEVVATTAAEPKKRERSVAAIEAEKRYYQKRKAEAAAAKEAVEAELAKPLRYQWEKAREILSEADPERYAEMVAVDEEINHLMWQVDNIEQGLLNNLESGQGWQDSDFNEDGTFKDESKPNMLQPEEVLADVQEALDKYGSINIPLTIEDCRRWSDFEARAQRDPAFWKYGFLPAVPNDLEARVEKVIQSLKPQSPRAHKSPTRFCTQCSEQLGQGSQALMCDGCQLHANNRATNARAFASDIRDNTIFDKWGRVKP